MILPGFGDGNTMIDDLGRRYKLDRAVGVASPSSTKPAITPASKPSVVSNDSVMPSRPADVSKASARRCSAVRLPSWPRSKSPIVAKHCHIDEQCENRFRFVASHLVA